MLAIRGRGGQSLIEVLVASGVGVILIAGASLIIAPALRAGMVATRTQGGAVLGRSLLDHVRTLAESDWHAIGTLTTSSASQYYINTSNSPFLVATGTQNITLATTTYAIYFLVGDVSRDGSGNIAGSGAYDPSTKKITAVYGAQNNATTTIVEYISRAQDRVLVGTDWSGGAGEDGPMPILGNSYAASVSVSGAITPGSLELVQ